MNLFNRIVVILLLLVGIISALSVIFLSLLFTGEFISGLRDAVTYLDEYNTLGLRIVLASFAALFALVGFLLLLLEVVPRAAKGVQLVSVTGSSAQLTLEAIISRIRYEAEALPAVRSVKPVVISRGKEVDVNLDLRTDPTVEIAAKTEEVSQVVRDAVENKMGVHLRRLRVTVYHDPYPKETRGKGNSRQATSDTASWTAR